MSTVKRAASANENASLRSQQPNVDSYQKILLRSFAVLKKLKFEAENQENFSHKFQLKIDSQTGECFEAFKDSDFQVSPSSNRCYVYGSLNIIKQPALNSVSTITSQLQLNLSPLSSAGVSMQALHILHIMKQLASQCFILKNPNYLPKEEIIESLNDTIKNEGTWEETMNQGVDFGHHVIGRKCIESSNLPPSSSLPYTTGELVVLKGEGGNFFGRWNPSIPSEEVVARWKTDTPNLFSKT